MNLRWSWDAQTRDLFRWVDPEQWDASIHDPVRLLGLVSRDRLEASPTDPGFMRFLDEMHAELSGYLSKPRWFQARRARRRCGSVGYFSPEFGIAEALPQYSGGLGVLAGDHLKAASRPRRAARRRRPLLPARLLPPGAVDRRLAAGALPRPRPVRDGPDACATACGSRSTSPASRCIAAGVAGRRRPRAAVPARRRHRGELRRPPPGHRPPLRRRRRAPAPPGDPARRRRRARARRRSASTTQVFHTNEGHAGFLGLERIRQLIVERRA